MKSINKKKNSIVVERETDRADAELIESAMMRDSRRHRRRAHHPPKSAGTQRSTAAGWMVATSHQEQDQTASSARKKSAASSLRDLREAKFVSFVRRLDDRTSSTSRKKGNKDTAAAITAPIAAEPPGSSLSALQECLKNEIILCECCNYRAMSNVSFVEPPPKNSRNDNIFHLTEASQIGAQNYTN